MKSVLVLTALFAIIWASKSEIKLQKQQQSLKQSSKELLELQKSILRLFRNIQQPDYYDDQKQIAVSYDIEDHIDNYKKPQVVREFWDLNRLGFLPKDKIFTIFNEQHRREAIALFKVLYYAKDYATLYNTACWARLFMNEGVFVYSLSVALVHRPDTAMIDLPPIYEIFPNYFYNMDVILEAQRARQLFMEEQRMPADEEQNIQQIQYPFMMQPRPPRPMENEPTFNIPMEMRTPQYRGMIPPQPLYSHWYNLLPEQLRPIRMDPAYILEMMKQDELRQQKLRQGKMMQEEMSQGKINEQEMKNEGMVSQDHIKINMERFDGITIEANYSRRDQNVEESLMNYFTEDVGFNAYYYYYQIYYPCWMPNEMINFETERRGEQFYYMMQQLLARYYLERLSNGLGEIPLIDYSLPIRTGYYPMMSYPNGMRFPMRPNNIWPKMQRAMENTQFSNNYTNSYAFVRDYGRRIKDAIDLGYVFTSTGKQIYLYDERGFETLGNMIEGNPETPNARFYGCLQIFVRLLLGNAQPTLLDREFVVAPSTLEHFETSLRDPVFYQFYKTMLTYFQRYMNNIPSYSIRDLLMPGVKIEDVQIVEPLTTYFEYDYIDISNAVYNKEMKEDMKRVPVRVRQLRLNNKPYRYVMNVNSDSTYNAMVKVFLGPKYDELGRRLDITESHLNFVEIDKFLVELNPGTNRIQRSSLQNCYTRDRTTYREMYMRVMMDINRSTLPEYEPREPAWCLPQRLLLPKGRPDGQTYQMYFIVTHNMPSKHQPKRVSESLVEIPRMSDSRPLGYPLDRPIDENDFYVPNSFFKDVIITHMGKTM